MSTVNNLGGWHFWLLLVLPLFSKKRKNGFYSAGVLHWFKDWVHGCAPVAVSAHAVVYVVLIFQAPSRILPKPDLHAASEFAQLLLKASNTGHCKSFLLSPVLCRRLGCVCCVCPQREAGNVWRLPPVWNLRAVIWFHFAISSLVLLPSPIIFSVWSFSACLSFLLNFFQKILQYFSLRDRLFSLAPV